MAANAYYGGKFQIMITLPTGIWVDGEHHRQIELRPLRGTDEAFLLDGGRKMPASTRVSHLLANCLTNFDGLDLKRHNPLDLVRAMSIGDREAALLYLRRATLGEQLSCILRCPECDEQMNVDLQIADLLLPPYEDVASSFQSKVGENGANETISFRLPQGSDQEAVIAMAQSDLAQAEQELINRCVIGNASELGMAHMPALLAQRDPQAEIRLQIVCPENKHQFSALFDAASFFFQEIMNRAEHLYREVHLLAFYYHWSEAEILNMTMTKRQRYLGFLESALSGGLV